MDNTAQDIAMQQAVPQPPPQPQVDEPLTQAVATPAVINPPVAQPPIVPVGSMQKESAPMPSVPFSEFVTPSEVAPDLHQEVKDAGVEVVPVVHDISLEDKKAGMSLAKEATPVPTAPSTSFHLATDYVSAQKAKSVYHRVSDSISWLYSLWFKQMQKEKEK